MKKSTTLKWIWTGLTIALLSLFRWLAGVAMPEAAWQFSIVATTIIMSGLITGWYVSRIWFINRSAPSNDVLLGLFGFIIAGVVVIAFLLNRMIGETHLFDFAITLLILFLVNAAFSAIVSLLRLRTQRRLQTADAAAAHSKSELQLLQSQLSPHFLFNTLNNIYGLSLTDHTRVPQLLLRLSDLLRYSIYDVNGMFVPVEQEMSYLQNYIEFEKIRLGDRWQLHCHLDPVPKGYGRIAPMLLIVFIENAFKHAGNVEENKVYIYIDITCEPDALSVRVRNSSVDGQSRSSVQERHSGFGLANVKKRLSLLYPGTHTLDIRRSENEYQVNVRLPVLK